MADGVSAKVAGAVSGQGHSQIIWPQTLVEALAPRPGDELHGAAFRNSAGQERYFSYADLCAESLRRAHALTGLGLQRGDRVALLLFEEADMALWFLAGVLAGLVPVLLAPRNATRSRGSDSASLAHIVATSEARIVLSSRSSTSRTLAERAMRWHSSRYRCTRTTSAICNIRPAAPASRRA
jgi:acyl-CoA synthetase (AMP-forming)/AMP-acid ligase II